MNHRKKYRSNLQIVVALLEKVTLERGISVSKAMTQIGMDNKNRKERLLFLKDRRLIETWQDGQAERARITERGLAVISMWHGLDELLTGR